MAIIMTSVIFKKRIHKMGSCVNPTVFSGENWYVFYSFYSGNYYYDFLLHIENKCTKTKRDILREIGMPTDDVRQYLMVREISNYLLILFKLYHAEGCRIVIIDKETCKAIMNIAIPWDYFFDDLTLHDGKIIIGMKRINGFWDILGYLIVQIDPQERKYQVNEIYNRDTKCCLLDAGLFYDKNHDQPIFGLLFRRNGQIEFYNPNGELIYHMKMPGNDMEYIDSYDLRVFKEGYFVTTSHELASLYVFKVHPGERIEKEKSYDVPALYKQPDYEWVSGRILLQQKMAFIYNIEERFMTIIDWESDNVKRESVLHYSGRRRYFVTKNGDIVIRRAFNKYYALQKVRRKTLEEEFIGEFEKEVESGDNAIFPFQLKIDLVEEKSATLHIYDILEDRFETIDFEFAMKPPRYWRNKFMMNRGGKWFFMTTDHCETFVGVKEEDIAGKTYTKMVSKQNGISMPKIDFKL